jgi:hypothetical protein
VSLLAGPGAVWELKFGSWVLLQPEHINAHAQAVIQTMRAEEHERGCLQEERVLDGDLTYHSSMARLEAGEERFVLLAMHQTLVERGLCLREHTDGRLAPLPGGFTSATDQIVLASQSAFPESSLEPQRVLGSIASRPLLYSIEPHEISTPAYTVAGKFPQPPFATFQRITW